MAWMPRNEVLWMLMMAVIGFGVMVPVAGLLADALVVARA